MLTRNGKMMKSSSDNYLLYCFGLPAGEAADGFNTCPGKNECYRGCYARMGNYNNKRVKSHRENNLRMSQMAAFPEVMTSEIKAVRTHRKKLIIRIHDDGDFYNLTYLEKWLKIIRANPDVYFYAYTKMVPFFNGTIPMPELPENLKIIYSYGGKWDDKIDPERDRHSQVFVNEVPEEYADASNDDKVAAFGLNHKIGLIWHGNHTNKKWGKQ